MPKFVDWLAEQKQKHQKPLVFTAYNASYDWQFMEIYLLKVGIIKNPFGIAPFDLKSLALALSTNWDWKQTAKSNLPPIILPDGDFTHHALEDCKYQQKLHFGIAGLLGGRTYQEVIKKQMRY